MCSIPGAMNSDLNSDSVFAVCAHAGVIEGSSRKKTINGGDQRRIDGAIISSRSKLRRSAGFRRRIPILPFSQQARRMAAHLARLYAIVNDFYKNFAANTDRKDCLTPLRPEFIMLVSALAGIIV